jgi:fructose-bisphosphate aldolase class II
MEVVQAADHPIPVALNLDHGETIDDCADCIEDGFSSVMIDASPLSFEENIKLTAEVVRYAHRYGVSVEGELGVISGIEDGVENRESLFTDPKQAKDFVGQTGVDSLAISIGNSHGVNKFNIKPGDPVPPLRLDILEKIKKILPGFPLVLHGTSSLPKKYVEIIAMYGGRIENAVGIPEDQIRRASRSAICKVNIASDGFLAMTSIVRKILYENPSVFDPRKYMGAARDELTKLYTYKNIEVLGSAGKA